ncbi:MAG: hypothetical protein ACJAYR_001961 [Sneathiella sp.]|jgi:hypothetical protein
MFHPGFILFCAAIYKTSFCIRARNTAPKTGFPSPPASRQEKISKKFYRSGMTLTIFLVSLRKFACMEMAMCLPFLKRFRRSFI